MHSHVSPCIDYNDVQEPKEDNKLIMLLLVGFTMYFSVLRLSAPQQFTMKRVETKSKVVHCLALRISRHRAPVGSSFARNFKPPKNSHISMFQSALLPTRKSPDAPIDGHSSHNSRKSKPRRVSTSNTIYKQLARMCPLVCMGFRLFWKFSVLYLFSSTQIINSTVQLGSTLARRAAFAWFRLT